MEFTISKGGGYSIKHNLENPFGVKDTYNTINLSEEILHKEKNSKFFGSAYPIQEDE
jgi:hypothetical protein